MGKEELPIQGKYTGHLGIIQNWIGAITRGEELLASGEEGIKGLEIANAIYLSVWTKNLVEIPIDANLFIDVFTIKDYVFYF
ncbi:putative dehydrogenase [Peribacillus sp. B2I2]|uniref:hypothetical protein n=1 Tax=Peribacillus sp. B2I2 TaxID=3156468 RepID=UPI003514CD7B